MGLWDWVMQMLSQPRSAARAGGFKSTKGWSTDATSQAVAVAEPPNDESPPESSETDYRWWAPPDSTLIAPVEPARPELFAQARAFENILVSHFDGHNLSMPPMLHAAEQALSRLREKNLNLRKVAEEISEDQVIAAAVLRMANSPLYRGLNKMTSILPAIARLGTKAVRTLMMHESMRAAMFNKKDRNRHFAVTLWRRSLSSAHIMRRLGELVGIDPDEASLIGLMHDIGNVIVLRIINAGTMCEDGDINLDTFEYLCFECHQEFGELVAAAWSLPQSLTSIIRDHHTPASADDPLRTERLLIELTDMINAMLGLAPDEQYDLLHARAVTELGLDQKPEFVQLLAALPEEVEEVVEAL